MLETALEIALAAHRNQKRLDDKPYVLHPLRMMAKARTNEERILCLLHDVVEDSDFTFDDLIGFGFSKSTIDALVCITHKEGEDYGLYINRVRSNGLSTSVKILDLEDNLDYREWPDSGEYFNKLKIYYDSIIKLKG